jgi:hypothetical protein
MCFGNGGSGDGKVTCPTCNGEGRVMRLAAAEANAAQLRYAVAVREAGATNKFADPWLSPVDEVQTPMPELEINLSTGETSPPVRVIAIGDDRSGEGLEETYPPVREWRFGFDWLNPFMWFWR